MMVTGTHYRVVEHAIFCIQLVSKSLSAATGCKARGSAFSVKRVLNVLQHASEPFSPRALTTSFSLGLATKQVLIPVVLVLSVCLSASGREQWTTEEAWAWHRKVGILRGFNEPQLGHPGMSREDVFQKAKDLGFNSVRAWLKGRRPPEQREFLRQLLEDAQAKGLTVSPVLKVRNFLRRGDDEESKARAKAYVQDIIGEFRDDPRITFWDLWNEPGLGNRKGEDKELQWTKEAILWAREVSPSQPITASVFWHLRAIRDSHQNKWADVEAMVDVHNFHLYNLSNDWMEAGEVMIAHLKKLSDRPIVCTEIVARSRGGTFGRSLSLFSKHHVHWYSWGLYVSDRNWHVAWRNSAFDSFEPWFHDVVHPDGWPYDWKELDLIRNFKFARAGEEVDPGAEVTERWSKWRSWKWMAVGPVRGWNLRPEGAKSWKDMWLSGSSATTTWTEQIQRAHAAGCNYLRIYLDFKAWKESPREFFASVDAFLSLAASRQIGVMPVLMTDADSGNPENDLMEYVSTLIRRYGFDKRVHAWELYNRPGGNGTDEKKVRPLLRSVFQAARFEFPNQPLTATPAVRVQDISPDFDYRRAFVHGRRAGWDRLQYEGGCDLSLCNYIWELSDVLSFPSGRRMPETGWLLSVANRYGRPVICTELSASDHASAEEILDLF